MFTIRTVRHIEHGGMLEIALLVSGLSFTDLVFSYTSSPAGGACTRTLL